MGGWVDGWMGSGVVVPVCRSEVTSPARMLAIAWRMPTLFPMPPPENLTENPLPSYPRTLQPSHPLPRIHLLLVLVGKIHPGDD